MQHCETCRSEYCIEPDCEKYNDPGYYYQLFGKKVGLVLNVFDMMVVRKKEYCDQYDQYSDLDVNTSFLSQDDDQSHDVNFNASSPGYTCDENTTTNDDKPSDQNNVVIECSYISKDDYEKNKEIKMKYRRETSKKMKPIKKIIEYGGLY